MKGYPEWERIRRKRIGATDLGGTRNVECGVGIAECGGKGDGRGEDGYWLSVFGCRGPAGVSRRCFGEGDVRVRRGGQGWNQRNHELHGLHESEFGRQR